MVVPHDMAILVQAMGGADVFRSAVLPHEECEAEYVHSTRLDTFFSARFHVSVETPAFEKISCFVLLSDMGDEPGFRECSSSIMLWIPLINTMQCPHTCTTTSTRESQRPVDQQRFDRGVARM